MTGTRQEHLDHIYHAIEKGFNFKQILVGLELRFDIGKQDMGYIHGLVDCVSRTPRQKSDTPTKPEAKPVVKPAVIPTPKPKTVSEYDVGFVVGQISGKLRLPRKLMVSEIRNALASPYLN